MQAPPIEPGIYRGVASHDYHAWPYASASRLKTLHRHTAAHMLAEMESPRDTPAMRLGELVHCRILEPEFVAERFVVAPDVDRRTKAGKAEWDAFVSSSAGKTVVTEDNMAAAEAMASAVMARRSASGLLALAPNRECSIISRMYGSLVKARVDAYGDGICIDIKTTSRGSGKHDFAQAISSMGYGLQAALYLNALADREVPVSDFVFIAVETDPPHAVAEYRLDNHIVTLYEQLLPKLLERYYDCVRSGVFGAWPDMVQEIGVSGWLRRQLEEEGFNV
jgi:hypothetical protein